MVVGRSSSEYRRSFKARLHCQKTTFENNFDYRLQRRQVEHRHHSGAFVWESDDSGSGNDSPPSCRQSSSARPLSPPPHKVMHDKLNDTYKKRIQELQQQTKQLSVHGQPAPQTQVNGYGREQYGADGSEEEFVRLRTPPLPPSPRGEKVCEPGHRDRRVQTPDWNRSAQTGKVSEAVQVPAVSDDYPGLLQGRTAPRDEAEKGHRKPTEGYPQRPKKSTQGPAYRKRFPRPRPLSAPVGRQLKKNHLEEKRPLFLPFGFYDKERETGTKKTHNVRASTQVYPAALNALKRRQAQIEQAERDAMSAPIRERRQKAHFNDKMARETSGWDTEYRNKFVGYNGSEYLHNVMAKLRPDSGRPLHATQ